MPTSQFKSNNYIYNEQYINKLENLEIRNFGSLINGWCAGYTMSELLNATYNTNKYHAEAVMRFLHPNLQGATIPIYWFNAKRDDLFGQTQGRSPQLLNRMTTYNEVDNLTKNNKRNCCFR